MSELSKQPEFVQYVMDNLWVNRRDRGIPWRKDVFDFIEETYGHKALAFGMKNWIEEGMVQADLIGLDDKLYAAYHERVSRFGVPEGFNFPAQKDAALAAISDPLERFKKEVIREHQAARMASWRARKQLKL